MPLISSAGQISRAVSERHADRLAAGQLAAARLRDAWQVLEVSPTSGRSADTHFCRWRWHDSLKAARTLSGAYSLMTPGRTLAALIGQSPDKTLLARRAANISCYVGNTVGGAQ